MHWPVRRFALKKQRVTLSAILEQPRRILPLAWILLATMLGCDGSNAGLEPLPTTPPADYAEFVARIPAAYCEGLYQCPGVAYDHTGNTGEWAAFRDEADCRAYYAGQPKIRITPALSSAIESGLVRFDPDAAMACLDAMRGLGPRGCAYEREYPRCAWVLVGSRAAGEVCSLGVECAPGMTCDRSSADGCSRCVTPPYPPTLRPGWPCWLGISGACGYGLDCVADSSVPEGGHCEEAPARPVAELGEPCSSEYGAEVPCRRGLACQTMPGDPTHGVCGEPLHVGATCTTDGNAVQSCALHTACRSTDDGRATCQWVRVGGQGARCETGENSRATCSFAENLKCIANRCLRVGTGLAGSPCYTDAMCAGGLACLAGTCDAPRADGESCHRHDLCASGYCRQQAGTTASSCEAYSLAPVCM